MNALVIRTLYNTQDWKDRCKQPYSDFRCYYCRRDSKLELDIVKPTRGCDPCDGSCWEQRLCNEFFWGCTPIRKTGRAPLWRQVQSGMKVFFVFRDPTSRSQRRYILWGKTTIKRIGNGIDNSGEKGKDGYHLIYFTPFRPTPRDRWRKNLTSDEIIGKDFGSGSYRYIPNDIAAKLWSWIDC